MSTGRAYFVKVCLIEKREKKNGDTEYIIIITIIIIINCNWVVTRWQWLFHMHTKHGIIYINIYAGPSDRAF